MSRILGIDYGSKRIGLAVSDPTGLIAQPAGCILNTDPETIFREIKSRIEKWNVTTILVGNPLRLNGTAGTASKTAVDFARMIREKLCIPVVLWDERLSTLQAEKLMISGGIRRLKRRKKIDSIAAMIVLQNYLDFTNARQTPEEAL
ncbi:Holliday junction resolvase RuvX [bacterium]|nr:Holliday junction resolvase RuvX [candidate division CSSED10-310 bacterium]